MTWTGEGLGGPSSEDSDVGAHVHDGLPAQQATRLDEFAVLPLHEDLLVQKPHLVRGWTDKGLAVGGGAGYSGIAVS